MAESIVSAALEQLTSQLVPGFSYGSKRSGDLLESLVYNLQAVRAVILDAEERQMVSSSLKVWMLRLEDVFYDADDLVDEISFDSLKRELEAGSASKIKTSKSWASSFFGSSSEKRYGKEVRSKIEKILARLDQLAAQKDRFNLRAEEGVARHRELSSSFADASDIFGRDKDKSEMMEMLLKKDADANFEAIGIIGMGGCGKTALAQLVFNHDEVRKHFDLRVWVCVSVGFDILKITGTIVQATSSMTYDKDISLNLLQSRLRENVDGKRFLLVLDDVWSESYEDWDILKAPLLSGAKGSKIILTTRSENVARSLPCSIIYHLHLLADQLCWEMFAKIAFFGRSKGDIETLQDIGKRIVVEKCQGLPLAVKVIAGVLRSKRSREEWLQVLNITSWEEVGAGDILGVLRLSYNHLPALLKRCFAYCSVFPKDYVLDKENLVLLWMAQGLLQHSRGSTMEEVGVEYLNSLIKRSFLEQSGDSYIKLHVLRNDLAQSVSEGLCSILELDNEMGSTVTERTRHLLVRGKFDALEKIGVIDQANSLRSLFLFDTSSDQLRPFSLQALLVRQQQLRALSLSHCQIAELPTLIGNLKHLRYLDLPYNTFKRLPESLCALYFLQTLILTNCSSLVMLPNGIVNLVNLRHLYITGAGLKQMPEEMSRLKSLQTLTNFVVGRGGSQIKEVGALVDLRRLSLSELQNVSSASDASAASLNAKRYLSELHLDWGRDSNDPTKQKKVLENLRPCKELKTLTIRYYSGIEFPSWLGDSSFSNITFLHLSDSNNCSSLPPLAQLPSLEHLIIEGFNGVTSISHEFYGEDQPFPHLKRLEFKGLSQWEQWISPELEEGVEFPCLEELYIQNCPKLVGGLPNILPSLLILEISDCQELKAQLPSVPERCELKLYGCDQVQQKSEKLPVRSFDVASELSSPLADQISIHSYDGFSQSSSSLTKNLHDAPSTSVLKMSEVPKVADPHDDQISKQEQQHVNQIQNLPSEDGKQHFSSLANVKVSTMAQLMDLPHELLSLRIESCDNLDSLPSRIKDSISLEELYIISCVSFRTFPQGHLATSLKLLYIRSCRSLELPPPKELNQFTLLEDLCLGSSCDCLKSFPLNCLPKLKTLSLWDCRNLEYLTIDKALQNDVKSLDALEIRDCPKLTTFPKEGLQAPCLTSLVLSNCSNLKSLPRWMQTLSSLQSLHINKCPELESLPSGGLPSSLKIFCINFCDKITPQTAWGLDKLNSLCHFEIEDGCKELPSFPEEGLLPINLKSLRISRLFNLKCLDENGIQELTSLQTLEINCCNELRSFPEDGLPSSLSFLRITDCSVLKQKLQKRKGKEWFKIAHIASIHLD